MRHCPGTEPGTLERGGIWALSELRWHLHLPEQPGCRGERAATHRQDGLHGQSRSSRAAEPVSAESR